MNAKRLLAIMFALALVFSFVACSDDDDTPAASSSSVSTSTSGSSNSSTSSTAGGGASDLFISEYFEPTAGNNKFIEVYNGTGASVDLATYTLASYPNGATTPVAAISLNSNTTPLANGAVLVVAPTDATWYTSADIKIAYYSGSPVHFTGNDAVGLFKAGTLVDIIGTIGDSADFGKDKKFIRKAGKGPATTWVIGDWTEGTATETDIGTIGTHTY